MIRRLLTALAWLLVRPTPARRPVADDTVADIPASKHLGRVFQREPTDPTQEAMDHLQGLCLQWLVMWCRYRREYMAIARFDTASPILFDADPQQLVFQCRAAELEQIGTPA